MAVIILIKVPITWLGETPHGHWREITCAIFSECCQNRNGCSLLLPG